MNDDNTTALRAAIEADMAYLPPHNESPYLMGLWHGMQRALRALDDEAKASA